MSHSLSVVGIRPPDDKWLQMKAAYDSCRTAGVDPPKAVEEFFNYESPDDAGVVVQLEDDERKYSKLHPIGAVREYSAEMVSGLEVDLKKLPKDITVLRFTVSY